MKKVVSMRKIVIKRNNTNILLYGIVFGVIFGIMAFPISSYLLDIGLSVLDSTIITLCISYPTATILLNLTVKIEQKPFNIPKSLVVILTVLGFLAVYAGATMRHIFLACAGALLIIGIWAWVIDQHRKTPKKEIVL